MIAESKKDNPGTKKCLVTGDYQDKTVMLRFVVGPNRILTLDLADKLPGRGFWFKADKNVLVNIDKVKRFINRKTDGIEVKIPADISTLVENSLVARIKDLFGLCRKAELLTLGFKKNAIALKEPGNFSALIIATNAAENSVNELHLESLASEITVLNALSINQLSNLAGEENIACIGLVRNKLSTTLANDIKRYSLFTGYASAQISKPTNSILT